MGVGACYNLSWLYQRPEGDLIFHFVARDDVDDYRLVQSLMDIADAGGIQRIGTTSCTSNNPRNLSEDPDRLLAAVRPAAHGQQQPLLRQLVNEDRTMGIRVDRRGHHDRSLPADLRARHSRCMPSAWRWARWTTSRCSRSHSPCGEQRCAPTPARPTGTYTLRVRLVAMDGDGRVIASVDSTQAYRGGQRGE